ncbi:Nn.00g095960.m01.CDS01 [Neocucurbitaria sp. VM-36]
MRLFSDLFSFFIATTLAVDVRTVYEFPKPTWLENIDVMRNGSFLVTTIGRAEVHIVNPSSKNSTSSLVTSIPNANAVLGITELTDDVFAVAAGNVTPSNSPITGSFAIWTIDLGCGDAAKVQKLADLPNVDMVNGIEALNPHTLLLADSWAGNIVKVDTKTGAYEVALSDPSLAANFSVPALPLGVNGIKFHAGYVYYSNTVQFLVGRVRVSPAGHALGPFTTIVSGPNISVPDDFAVAKDGSIYQARPLAAPQGDTLQHITLDGRVETVAEGGAVAGATAVRFGRTRKDRDMVYLSTMGGFGADGTPVAGGRIAAVRLGRAGREL